jgi:hypothetical protein
VLQRQVPEDSLGVSPAEETRTGEATVQASGSDKVAGMNRVESAPAAGVRVYEAHAETTSTFGRVSYAVRQYRLTVDGPVQSGCPGEAPTPGEFFLTAAAAYGAEVLQVACP